MGLIFLSLMFLISVTETISDSDPKFVTYFCLTGKSSQAMYVISDLCKGFQSVSMSPGEQWFKSIIVQ